MVNKNQPYIKYLFWLVKATEEQYRFLDGNQCDFKQGYLICKPLTENEILEFLSKVESGFYSTQQ